VDTANLGRMKARFKSGCTKGAILLTLGSHHSEQHHPCR